MICYDMLWHVVLCYVMLCYVMLCHVMLCSVMWCYEIFYPFHFTPPNICLYTHTNINTIINTKIIILSFKQYHTLLFTLAGTHIHTHSHTHMHTQTPTYTHVHTQTHTYTHTHTHTHIHTLSLSHTHTPTHTHTSSAIIMSFKECNSLSLTVSGNSPWLPLSTLESNPLCWVNNINRGHPVTSCH